jgi:uncharacterized repeat protein (TIGR01451 family)
LRRVWGPLFAFAAVASSTVAGAADSKGVFNPVPAELQTAFQTIASAGPLNQIFLGVDVAAQIAHTGDASYNVYPPDTTPGDYGTFLVVGGTLYAPDFENHGGTASGSIGVNVPFTPISQSGVGGTGTSGDPFTVTTVVGVGTTGLTISQVDSYVIGQESYRTDVSITNGSGSAVAALLYRAMDCYLGGSDSGYGLVTGTAVGCSATPNNSPPDRIEQLVPLTGGNNYYQAGYDEVWTAIGTHAPFNNTCRCTEQIDNGAGISWNIDIPAGGTVTRSNLTVFSPLGAQALFVTKTADAPSVAAGGADGYTIVVTNPNSTATTLNSIIDTLPAGFAYTAGSTTGATTADPTIAAQVLTWNGPFNAPAGGTVSLHFAVTASSTDGTYFNQATADAGTQTVAGTGLTAPITVGGGPPPPPNVIPTPTLSTGMLAVLILLLLACGVIVARRAR